FYVCYGSYVRCLASTHEQPIILLCRTGLTATHKNSGWQHGSRLRGHPEFRSYPLVVFRLQRDEAVVESVAAVHHGRLRILIVDEEVEVVAHQLHLAECLVDAHRLRGVGLGAHDLTRLELILVRVDVVLAWLLLLVRLCFLDQGCSCLAHADRRAVTGLRGLAAYLH